MHGVYNAPRTKVDEQPVVAIMERDMTVFVLVFKNPVDELAMQSMETKLTKAFGETNIKALSSGQYLISSDKYFRPEDTAKELGDSFNKGEEGSYLMTTLEAYWGYHDRSVWSWLKEKGL